MRLNRKIWIGLGILVIALVAFRLALPGLVKDFVNKKLNELDSYTGHVDDVDIALIRGAYAINLVEVKKRDEDRPPVPFFEARRVEFSVQWKELFHGSMVSEIDVYRSRLNFVKGPTEAESQTTVTNDWIRVVDELFPFRINRFTIHDSELRYHDFHSEPKVDVAITNMTIVATNLTNSRDIESMLPADLRIAGESIGGGKLDAHVKLNPLAYEPTFKGKLRLTDVNMVALNDFFEAYANIDLERGELDLFAEMAAAEGKFEGYVRPLMRDIDILDFEADNENPLKLAWQTVVAGVVKIFKNHPEDQFATQVPFEGSFDNPQTEVWTTVKNVLKNAFVEAFRPRFDNAFEAKVSSNNSDKKKAEK